eukprot:3726662-Pyramimonas_sp.AAC.1
MKGPTRAQYTPSETSEKRATNSPLCSGGLLDLNRPATKGRLVCHSSAAAEPETDPKCFWKRAFFLSFS